MAQGIGETEETGRCDQVAQEFVLFKRRQSLKTYPIRETGPLRRKEEGKDI